MNLEYVLFLSRSSNGGNGSGSSSFISYLQEQTGPGWIPVTDPQTWVANQPKSRQVIDTMISSCCNAMDGDQSHLSQEALLQPVRDMGHSEILRGHFRGTQPFEKGLGFPHRAPELRAWDDVRFKGQVSKHGALLLASTNGKKGKPIPHLALTLKVHQQIFCNYFCDSSDVSIKAVMKTTFHIACVLREY